MADKETWMNGFNHPKFKGRMGRPPVPEDRQLVFSAQTRLTEGDWEMVVKRSLAEGIKPSEFMRRAILKELGR